MKVLLYIIYNKYILPILKMKIKLYMFWRVFLCNSQLLFLLIVLVQLHSMLKQRISFFYITVAQNFLIDF